MTSLNYLRKTRLDEELDKLIFKNLKLTYGSIGETCKKCGAIQGNSSKGFKHYYCKHLTQRIDRKSKKEKELIAMKVMDLMYQDVQDNK